MTGPERRQQRRERVDFPVRIRIASGEEFDGVVDNLGENGALVATPNLEPALDVGATVTLRHRHRQGGRRGRGRGPAHRAGVREGDIRLSFAVRFVRPLALP